MDPLSDVLRAVKLNGAFFYLVEAAAPWSVTANGARDLVPRILPDAEHLISYHILLTGSCWGGVDGDSQVLMKPGDVIVFPHGDAHVMSSAKGLCDGDGRDGTSPERYELSNVFPYKKIFVSYIRVCFHVRVHSSKFSAVSQYLGRVKEISGVSGQFPFKEFFSSSGRALCRRSVFSASHLILSLSFPSFR